MALARESDLLLILAKDGKRFIVRLERGQLLHTHRGIIAHDDLIGAPLGQVRQTHLGYPYVALRPSIHDLVMDIKRASQIVYPKEAGYILLKLNVGPGSRVVEGGTGSGALTMVLAHAVRPDGRVYTYESREDMCRLAAKNLANVGLADVVEIKQRDIATGFDERDADAVFLDVRTPWLYLDQAREALSDGGFFGAIVPTANQVSELIDVLGRKEFMDIEVCEILLRSYKPVPTRLRPVDRMVAHTGYLVFARKSESVREVFPEGADET
ncbi:MAG: tRNA (adenine-N1)-methyltransferase [Chloroflexi bacterium]|nr:tRNA (adenine-N1)-methyltransferase [Chloroflexota bacterium]